MELMIAAKLNLCNLFFLDSLGLFALLDTCIGAFETCGTTLGSIYSVLKRPTFAVSRIGVRVRVRQRVMVIDDEYMVQ